jgi:hypothetical protein
MASDGKEEAEKEINSNKQKRDSYVVQFFFLESNVTF